MIITTTIDHVVVFVIAYILWCNNIKVRSACEYYTVYYNITYRIYLYRYLPISIFVEAWMAFICHTSATDRPSFKLEKKMTKVLFQQKFLVTFNEKHSCMNIVWMHCYKILSYIYSLVFNKPFLKSSSVSIHKLIITHAS